MHPIIFTQIPGTNTWVALHRIVSISRVGGMGGPETSIHVDGREVSFTTRATPEAILRHVQDTCERAAGL